MSTDLPAWPDGYGHLPLGEVTSTLDVARDEAGQYPNPTWFTATRQTAARGRRGRAWVEPEGNFAATLSLIEAEPARAALRSFVAALALADALSQFVDDPSALSLKWPNDVLLKNGKVAGILLEGLLSGAKPWGVAIGFGVNLAKAPPVDAVEEGAVEPIALADVSPHEVTPDRFLVDLAAAFATWEARFQSDGFAEIRLARLDRAARLGETITARAGPRTITGIFETIDAQGQLVLRGPKGQIAIPAADVFF